MGLDIPMLLAVILGPITAVGITLWIEGRRRDRDQKIQILRMLLSTRHLPGDPSYSLSVNMIPVEFNDKKAVVAAWKTYMDCVRYTPSQENKIAHDHEIKIKQTKMIFEIMRSLGFSLSETDIQDTAYAASGMIERDNLMLNAWASWPRIAAALEVQNQISAAMIGPNGLEQEASDQKALLSKPEG